jgi:hypothetical protein
MRLVRATTPASGRQTLGMATAAVVLVVLNLTLIGLTAWKIWQAQQPQPAKPVPIAVAEPMVMTSASAKGAFSISFPEGWNTVLRVMDSDRFVVPGTTQPVASDSIAAKVTDVTTYVTATDAVFDAVVDDDFPQPQGVASDILIGTGKSLLSGKKFVNTYQGGDPRQQRANGDVDIMYSFPLGGTRELRVTYRNFSADRTDNRRVVDDIVRSIKRL